jgi:hypothetical protein
MERSARAAPSEAALFKDENLPQIDAGAPHDHSNRRRPRRLPHAAVDLRLGHQAVQAR